MKSTINIKLLQAIIIFLAGGLFTLYTLDVTMPKPEGEPGVIKEEPTTAGDDRVRRLEQSYLETLSHLELERQKSRDYEEIISELMEEKLSESMFERLEFKKRIERENIAYVNRVKPTLAQTNQITSWLQGNFDNEHADFNAFLKNQVLFDEQYEAFVKYRADIAYANKLQIIAELIKAIEFTDETLEEIYNHEYSSTEEALEKILTQDQYDQWVRYNQ